MAEEATKKVSTRKALTLTEDQKQATLATKMLTVIREVGVIDKTGTAPGAMGGFAFREHDQMVAALRPILIKHGISLWPSVIARTCEQHVGQDSRGKPKTTFMVHVNMQLKVIDAETGFSLWIEGHGEGFDRGDKATGKAITSCIKSMYLKLFMLEGNEDIEVECVEAADEPKPKRQPKPKAEPKEEPRSAVMDAAVIKQVEGLATAIVRDGPPENVIAKSAEDYLMINYTNIYNEWAETHDATPVDHWTKLPPKQLKGIVEKLDAEMKRYGLDIPF